MMATLPLCRELFGNAPRRFTWRERWYQRITPPAWMRQPECRDDALWEIYRQQRVLFDGGRIVWGALVQANTLLFSPGKHDSPAAVLYSTDPYYDDRPEELLALAHGLYRQKGTTPDDPVVAELARLITDEYERAMASPLPETLTGGRCVTFTSIMACRKHLPEGILGGGVFPLVILPEVTPATLILPERYWSWALRQSWA